VLERGRAKNAVIEQIIVLDGVYLSGVVVEFLGVVLFVAHSLEVEHLDHLIGDELLLVVEVVVDFGGGFGDDGDGVGVEAAGESAFEDLAVLDWVVFEDFVDVFGGGFDAQTFEVLGGVLLLEEFEEGWVFEVDFLT
jgi:hypothetical protein